MLNIVHASSGEVKWITFHEQYTIGFANENAYMFFFMLPSWTEEQAKLPCSDHRALHKGYRRK